MAQEDYFPFKFSIFELLLNVVSFIFIVTKKIRDKKKLIKMADAILS